MTLSSRSAVRARTQPERGSVREVFALAYPVALTQLSVTVMGVVDSAMVGRLGATPLAAVGFGNIWLWTFFSLFYGTASGVQTFVSQYDGAGEPRRCGSWAWHGFWAVVPAVAGVSLLLSLAAGPAFALLGPSPELQVHAAAYVRARLPGEVGMAVLMVLASFFRGFGDTRTPLYVTLVANAVNAVLDYGLVFGRLGLPAWGVAGAGAATSVGSWCAALILLAAFRRRSLRQRFDTRALGPDRAAIRRFLRTGAPIGGQWCLGMTSFATFTTLVARMGDAPMAASQAFVMLLSLSFMQAVGLAVGASTLVGRYVGAGDPDAAERSLRSALRLGAVVATAVAALYVSIPGLLLRIFTDDPAVVSLGVPLLAIGAVFQLCDAVGIITEGALRGAGDTRWPFLAHTLLGWGFFVPAAWTLGIALGGGLRGAWLAGLLYVASLSSVLVWRFRSGSWRHVRI
jgi:MATE family, multidrug efflux pump